MNSKITIMAKVDILLVSETTVLNIVKYMYVNTIVPDNEKYSMSRISCAKSEGISGEAFKVCLMMSQILYGGVTTHAKIYVINVNH